LLDEFNLKLEAVHRGSRRDVEGEPPGFKSVQERGVSKPKYFKSEGVVARDALEI
jgi:hypothetical protein